MRLDCDHSARGANPFREHQRFHSVAGADVDDHISVTQLHMGSEHGRDPLSVPVGIVRQDANVADLHRGAELVDEEREFRAPTDRRLSGIRHCSQSCRLRECDEVLSATRRDTSGVIPTSGQPSRRPSMDAQRGLWCHGPGNLAGDLMRPGEGADHRGAVVQVMRV